MKRRSPEPKPAPPAPYPPNKTPKAVIIDLDGTLCDTAHRQHFMQGEKKDWPGFYKAIARDPVARWCDELIDAMIAAGYCILLVSGRPKTYEPETMTWLMANQIRFDELHMRREGDFRKDRQIKKEIYESDIKPFYDVVFCVDDRQQVVDMWREIGLTCLQCAEGDF